MGITIFRYPVAINAPTRVATAANYQRRVEVSNVGTAVVWLGADDVGPGRGRPLEPDDEPYVYGLGDELFAVAFSPTTVTVVEET